MTPNHSIRRCALALVAAIGLAASAVGQAAEKAVDLSPFVGTWKINLAKTKMGRMGPTGPNIQRDPTFTWIFEKHGDGLLMKVYEKLPRPEPNRTFEILQDGKVRNCVSSTCLTTGGDPKTQTYKYWIIDGHMLSRLFWAKDQPDEYSSYAVSADGKTLMIVSWSPGTPEYQNIQVFDKQP